MKDYKQIFDELQKEIGKVIVGQENVAEQIIIAILCDGNALLEGYPGLAKTLMVRTLAQLMDLKFSRKQNTPDLMPSDITGTYIIEEASGKRQFKFQPGPVFATQNPIEQEGTYPLPEAQADRFLLKINVTYPTYDQELQIVDRYATETKEQKLKVLLNKNHLLTLQNLTRQVPIANDIKQRAVKIVFATRSNKEIIQYGASPRASIGLILASKARALVQGRNHVSNDDLNMLAYPVLRHRIILNFEAERKVMSVDDAIKNVLDKTK